MISATRLDILSDKIRDAAAGLAAARHHEAEAKAAADAAEAAYVAASKGLTVASDAFHAAVTALYEAIK